MAPLSFTYYRSRCLVQFNQLSRLRKKSIIQIFSFFFSLEYHLVLQHNDTLIYLICIKFYAPWSVNEEEDLFIVDSNQRNQKLSPVVHKNLVVVQMRRPTKHYGTFPKMCTQDGPTVDCV